MDNHATTPLDPRVLEVMLPYFTEHFGNASSRQHVYGWTAEAAVDHARQQVAALLDAAPGEIVFTSGATESNNLAIRGAAAASEHRGRHVVTALTEHKAVLDCCARLEREGYELTYLSPGPDGLLAADAVAAAVRADTVLVSLMHANNEIGVVLPIAEIAARVKAVNERTLVHCDAAQSAGILPLSVREMGVDLVSLSAHKMYGPKGVGALWVRRRPRVHLVPLLCGGGQEGGLRPGTTPVPLVVGFGRAAELARQEKAEEAVRLAALRDRLWQGLAAGLDRIQCNGAARPRLPGNLHVSFAGVDGETLLMALRDLAVSSGAACASASREPSHVLAAIGVERSLASASLRFGLGRFNCEAEVDRAVVLVVEAVQRLRALEIGVAEPAQGL
jgi:cysteine desulfurase